MTELLQTVRGARPHGKRPLRAAAAQSERSQLPNRRQKFLKMIALGLLACSLLYLIIRHSVPAGLTTNFPNVALSLNSKTPDAVVAVVQQAVYDEAKRRIVEASGQKDGGGLVQEPIDLDALRAQLVSVLKVSPLNATAFRLLAQIAGLEGDTKTTRQMMRLATKLSPNETLATNFMMNEALASNNARAALHYADILMRSSSQASNYVAPIVGRLFEVPAAQGELMKQLASNPPWRAQVLGSIPTSGLVDYQAPLLVFAAMADSQSPVTEKETSGYVNYLLQKRLYPFAHSVWRQFLPDSDKKDDGLLFNGSFERQPSGLPFDWTIGQNSETKAGIYARPDDASHAALLIRFGVTRTTFPTIQETIVLTPGEYHFTGRLRGELQARRGLQWRLTCVEGTVAGESGMFLGRVPDWKSFEFNVKIPAEKCAAQYVQLTHMARSPSEQLASGYMWFDELKILPAPASPLSEPRPSASDPGQSPR